MNAVDLKMWLFQPEDHDPDKDSRPAIVFFFGGGWKSGFLKSLGWLEGESTIRVVDHDFVSLRGHVQNSFLRFASEKQGHVAFIGGSITEMDGYRPRITAWLQKRFPEVACSKFRLTHLVWARPHPELAWCALSHIARTNRMMSKEV